MGVVRIVLLLVLSLASVGWSEPVNLDYLGGDFTEASGTYDFYFCCNVEGPNLQWVINETGYALYLPGQLLTHPVRRESLSNFNYTSTLLSSTVAGVHQRLDSVLFVSVQGNITINVGCVSDVGSNISSNRETEVPNKLLQANSSDGLISISMFRLWDDQIVGDTNDSTRCFMCEVNFSSQLWETDNNDQLTFDTGFPLGSESNLPSIDNNFLRLQTVLYARSPKLVSIFLVTDSTVGIVTCNAGGLSLSSAELRNVTDTSTGADIADPTTPDVTTTDLVGSQHTFETTTEDSDEKFQPSPSSLVKALPGIVVAMVAIVMTVVVALMVVYMIKKKIKCPHCGKFKSGKPTAAEDSHFMKVPPGPWDKT